MKRDNNNSFEQFSDGEAERNEQPVEEGNQEEELEEMEAEISIYKKNNNLFENIEDIDEDGKNFYSLLYN
jgi:hypothetical protein